MGNGRDDRKQQKTSGFENTPFAAALLVVSWRQQKGRSAVAAQICQCTQQEKRHGGTIAFPTCYLPPNGGAVATVASGASELLHSTAIAAAIPTRPKGPLAQMMCAIVANPFREKKKSKVDGATFWGPRLAKVASASAPWGLL
jgi:hypothetical protein